MNEENKKKKPKFETIYKIQKEFELQNKIAEETGGMKDMLFIRPNLMDRFKKYYEKRNL